MSRVENRPINVGLIGMGTVGTGVVRWFQDGWGEKFNLNLKRVAVRDLTKPRVLQFSELTDNPADILKDPSIDIIIELMGGISPAREITLDAIDARKSVIDANKALLGRYMKEIFDAVRSRGVNFAFEASVCGGIPIMNVAHRLRGEAIDEVLAINNGTGNYILDKMTREGADFGPSLRGAQDAGYAEKDPTRDIKGLDAQDKLAVLASILWDTQIDISKIPCTGITNITAIDIDFANTLKHVIKLLAIGKKNGDSVELRITPALIREDHPLASAKDALNRIYLKGSMLGGLTIEAGGAGEGPTSSAVVSDLIHVAENIRRDTTDELPKLDRQVTYVDPSEVQQKGYIRANLVDEPGSLHKVSGILYRRGLNMKDSIQRAEFGFPVEGHEVIPDTITLNAAPYRIIESALKGMKKSGSVHGEPFFLPILD